MDRKSIIESVEAFVKENISDYDTGHDWFHIQRVRYLALAIAKEENAGSDFILVLASLLHDIGDSKFRKHDDSDAGEVITGLLDNLGVEKEIIEEVVKVNRYISFSSREKHTEKSEVFKIVQDADRLDAIGAIGIARAFNYGGFRNNAIYLPEEKSDGRSKSTIGHFHDKLLKLNGMMNTSTGRRIGDKRHKILERFLEQFYEEWNFKK
jgi:uncharacterized protein